MLIILALIAKHISTELMECQERMRKIFGVLCLPANTGGAFGNLSTRVAGPFSPERGDKEEELRRLYLRVSPLRRERPRRKTGREVSHNTVRTTPRLPVPGRKVPRERVENFLLAPPVFVGGRSPF